MKSLSRGFNALFAIAMGFQSVAYASLDSFGSRNQRTPNFGLVSEMSNALIKGDLPHVDYTHKSGQWTAKDFANFVRDLPANIKQVQVYSYFPTGLYCNGLFFVKDDQLAQKIADFINNEEVRHGTKLFSLRPQGLPGYKVEPRLARFHPTYVPASGKIQVAQYQQNGEYFALLIETINKDGSITLVNGKTLKTGEFLLAIPQLGDAKIGVAILYQLKNVHMDQTRPQTGDIYRVFQDGSIQLTNQRHVFSHVDYELPLSQNGDLKPGVFIHYFGHEHSREIKEGQIAVVFKNYVVLSDRETIVPLEAIQAYFACESLLVPDISGFDFNHGK